MTSGSLDAGSLGLNVCFYASNTVLITIALSLFGFICFCGRKQVYSRLALRKMENTSLSNFHLPGLTELEGFLWDTGITVRQ
jgi:hypothetical protein